jgi:diguanylate cyclase (GGDEF)-like protein/PAS domain S-box-containing protein
MTAPPQKSSLKILLAEDSPTIALANASMLNRLGHVVVLAKNGREAVALYKRERPDLVLMDVVMPEIGGLDATRMIKMTQVDLWVPVIILTSQSEEEEVVAGLEAGADDYLIKPLSSEMLQAKISAMQRIATLQQDAFDNRARLQNMVDHLVDAVVVVDAAGNIEKVNRSTGALFGYAEGDMLGKPATLLFPESQQENFKLLFADLVQSRQALDFCTDSHTVGQRKNGDTFPMSACISTMLLHSGQRILCTFRDISERRMLEDSLKMQAHIVNQIPDSVVTTDIEGKILSWNKGSEHLYGFTEREMIGKPFAKLFPDGGSRLLSGQLRTALKRDGKLELGLQAATKTGEVRDISLSLSMLRDERGTTIGVIGYSVDITLAKQAQRQLEHLASHDPLTQIPNRYLFNDRIHHAISRAARGKYQFAVLFIDLDGFKAVNDTLGHDVGDAVLQIIAARLAFTLRKSDTVARFGGDEFAILLEQVTNPEVVGMLARNLINTINEPVEFQGQRIHVGASIGIALYPRDGCDCQKLIKHADVAMYSAKHAGKNTFQFKTE